MSPVTTRLPFSHAFERSAAVRPDATRRDAKCAVLAAILTREPQKPRTFKNTFGPSTSNHTTWGKLGTFHIHTSACARWFPLSPADTFPTLLRPSPRVRHTDPHPRNISAASFSPLHSGVWSASPENRPSTAETPWKRPVPCRWCRSPVGRTASCRRSLTRPSQCRQG